MGSNLHANKTRKERGKSPKQECNGAKEGISQCWFTYIPHVVSARFTFGAEAFNWTKEEEDGNTKYSGEDTKISILRKQKRGGPWEQKTDKSKIKYYKDMVTLSMSNKMQNIIYSCNNLKFKISILHASSMSACY